MYEAYLSASTVASTCETVVCELVKLDFFF